MGRKLIALIGFGAGIALVRKEMKENPSGPVAKTVNAVSTNPTVVATTQSAKQKATQIIQDQGEKLTDKIADMIKERLFGVPTNHPAPSATSSPVQPAAATEPGQPITLNRQQPIVPASGVTGETEE